jgi:hypothetical protein
VPLDQQTNIDQCKKVLGGTDLAVPHFFPPKTLPARGEDEVASGMVSSLQCIAVDCVPLGATRRISSSMTGMSAAANIAQV